MPDEQTQYPVKLVFTAEGVTKVDVFMALTGFAKDLLYSRDQGTLAERGDTGTGKSWLEGPDTDGKRHETTWSYEVTRTE